MTHFVRYVNANRKEEATEGSIRGEIEERCLHLECLAAVISMAIDDQSGVTQTVKEHALYHVETQLREQATAIWALVFAMVNLKEGKDHGRDEFAHASPTGFCLARGVVGK